MSSYANGSCGNAAEIIIAVAIRNVRAIRTADQVADPLNPLPPIGVLLAGVLGAPAA
jgi:hypothetical protein